MRTRNGDINDDEIRIISSGPVGSNRKKRRLLHLFLWGFASLILIGVLVILFFSTGDIEEESIREATSEQQTSTTSIIEKDEVKSRAYTLKTDTVVDGIGLSILTPNHASPFLEIGNEATNDSTVILIVQAADIRADNGGIVGSYVVAGELKSKGEAKAGFCSIINGNVTVGVADATPMFEQALTNNGFFFRQYPLVVGCQIVENKPKGKAFRKALAEINSKISVIVSHEQLTYHVFSQALINVGANNAISLVGGNTYGRYVNANGEIFTFGSEWNKEIDNVNYIAWR